MSVMLYHSPSEAL